MHDPFHPGSTLGAKIIISHPQASASAGVTALSAFHHRYSMYRISMIPPTLYIMATAMPPAGQVQRASRGYRKPCQGDLMTAASVSSQQRRAQQLKRSDW